MAGEIVIRIAVPDGINVDVDYVDTGKPVESGHVGGTPYTAQPPAEAPRYTEPQGVTAAQAQAIFTEPMQYAQGGSQVPSQPPGCPEHGPMRYYPGGHNDKTGRDFNASYRCPVPRCTTRPVWGV